MLSVLALGRPANFGDLYNANTNEFTGTNVVYGTTTKKESFNPKLEALKDYFDFSGIHGATHVVTGIQYGGNVVVSMISKSSEIKNESEFKGNLEAKLKSFFEGNISRETQGFGNINDNEIGIIVESDANKEEGDDLTSLEGAKKFVENFGERLKKYNNGKGIQISFELTPLKTILEYHSDEIIDGYEYVTLEQNVILEFTQLLSKIEDIKNEVDERIFKLEENRRYFARKDQDWWNEKKNKFEIMVATSHAEIEKTYKLYQNDTTVAHENLVKQQENVKKQKENVADFILESEKFLVKLAFIKEVESFNIEYITEESRFAHYKLKEKSLYITLYSDYYYYKNSYSVLRTILLEVKNNTYSDKVYIFVDAEILEDMLKREFKKDNLNDFVYQVIMPDGKIL